MTYRLYSLITLLLSAQAIHAQELLLTSSKQAIYNVGDTVQFNATLLSGTSDSIQLTIWNNYHAKPVKKKLPTTGVATILYRQPALAPGTIIVEASTDKDTATLGAVIAPNQLRMSGTRPRDIDQYWQKERKALRAMPLQVQLKPVSTVSTATLCFDAEINCTGPAPARGYFAKPQAAAAHSLPIVLYLHAAGVKGNWCQAQPEIAVKYASMGRGALSFDLNAHGMLNGQPQSYYDSLEQSVLANYYNRPVTTRQAYYFRGMYLRLMRVLDFLTQQPQWDGKHILVMGESQGGGQALVAAGLDHRVTDVVVTVPALCDYAATLDNSKGGWPNPYLQVTDLAKANEVLPYFDAGWLLTGCKANLVTEIGLIDFTCPSSSIYAAINQATGKKIVYAVPYRAHHMSQPYYQSTWNNTVRDPREAYIARFLGAGR
ncbi:MAG TPA: acetylxylan esterase [Chitinophagaceae bacterium]|nr:acetylxylan esterase [Chitinophagaceae bacterium]